MLLYQHRREPMSVFTRNTGGGGKGREMVYNPGKFAVVPGTTILQFLAEIGGFTEFAAVKRIQIRRGSAVYTVNYQAIEAGTDTSAQMVMKTGDVIIVPQRRLFE